MESAVPPFANVLVPYDGSEPAKAALGLAILLGQHGARITVATVVDETPTLMQAESGTVVYDPQPVLDELDADFAATLEAGAARCRAANVAVTTASVHDRPVAGILGLQATHQCDLIVMGTHGRTGLERLFLGSTTDGVLRASPVPVLTVRDAEHAGATPFSAVVAGLDDSEPATAAARVAATLARTAAATVTACCVIQTDVFYEAAGNGGFDPQAEIADVRAATLVNLRTRIAAAGLGPETALEVDEGDPTDALLAAAGAHHATLILVGTHGRSGLDRLFLGSVAERLVRTSPIPVLVVPAAHPAATP